MSLRTAFHRFAAGLVTVCLAGCVNLDPQPDPTRYYVLDDPAEPGLTPPADCPRVVLVGPVRVAGYADQSVVVERRGEHEIVPLALHRWAEPPGQALPRVLTSRLARALPGVCVAPLSRRTPATGTIQLEAEITRFELTDQDQAVVAVRWRAFEPGHANVEQGGVVTGTQSFTAGDQRIAAGVGALSRALDETVRQLGAQLGTRD